MIVRALDSLGDWTFGRGKNDYLSKNAAIRQNIQTRLLSFLGDCFFDIQAGIDWFNLLGSKNQDALKVALASTIINTTDVVSLTQLLVGLNPRTRRITIQYTATTVYTDATIPSSTLISNQNFLLTEGGSILTTEDGDPLVT